MNLRSVLASLMVVVLLAGLAAPLAGAQPDGATSDEEYGRLAPVEGHGPGADWPGVDAIIFWESIDDISSTGRARPAAAVVDGKIYLFGGELYAGYEDTVEMFDPAAGVWVDMAGLMPKPASNICAVAIGTDIYIPGGYGDPRAAFLTRSRCITSPPTRGRRSLPIRCRWPRPGSGLRGCGRQALRLRRATTSSAYISKAYVYDPAAAAGSRWTALPDMAYARAWLAGVRRQRPGIRHRWDVDGTIHRL